MILSQINKDNYKMICYGGFSKCKGTQPRRYIVIKSKKNKS